MWDGIAAWFQSPGGARVLQTAVVPAIAILVAGVLAALIGRSAVASAIRRADREQAATAVAGLVEAARAAADADGSRGDRRRAARLRTEADVRVRLLPLPGAERAADWSAERTDALLGDPDPQARLGELRDALIAWVRSPKRARRLFAAGSRPSAPVALAPLAAEEDVPAWRRTRSAERLQQQRDAREAPPADPTAPVRLQRTHRAEPATIAEAEQLERVETHRAAGPTPTAATPAATTSQAAPADRPQPAVDGEERPRPPARGEDRPAKPEWLDDYDDEAHVTQTMNLKTPPPVAASRLRDRAPAGDIVPRP